MSDIKLTVKQAAHEIGESVHVLRNWLSDFRTHIPLEKSESGYNLFTQESINVIRQIQKMSREQKLTTRQIAAILSGAEKPITPDEKEMTPAIREEIEELKQMIRAQQSMNIEVMQRIESHIKKRDEQLMHVLAELREQRKMLQASSSRPWWKRWSKR